MKTHWKRLLWALFLAAFASMVHGQGTETAVRFTQSDAEMTGDHCYRIELRQLSGPVVSLGTQNYRIYYDASQLRFLRQEVYSLLETTSHSPARVIQAVHNSDASGFGNLEFSSTLGFINININDTGSPNLLPPIPDQEWMPTVALCFEALSAAPASQLVWGRKGLTDGYATAFTRISVVHQDGETTMPDLLYEDLITERGGLKDKMAVTDIKE